MIHTQSRIVCPAEKRLPLLCERLTGRNCMMIFLQFVQLICIPLRLVGYCLLFWLLKIYILLQAYTIYTAERTRCFEPILKLWKFKSTELTGIYTLVVNSAQLHHNIHKYHVQTSASQPNIPLNEFKCRSSIIWITNIVQVERSKQYADCSKWSEYRNAQATIHNNTKCRRLVKWRSCRWNHSQINPLQFYP